MPAGAVMIWMPPSRTSPLDLRFGAVEFCYEAEAAGLLGAAWANDQH
jgi:hypothetical protein